MAKLGIVSFSAACAAASVVVGPGDARACGGCFHPANQAPEQESVVTSHRMALSISTTQTVLWDQVEYAGSPSEFAWVLPIKPGAYVEVASDAWFEALDAATTVRVNQPLIDCPGVSSGGMACVGPVPVGCSASAADSAGASEIAPPAPDPVTVVHQGSAGPYDTVTLHSDVPGALNTWLDANGYAVDDGIQPIIDAYAKDGFDFIALRLAPNQGVQQMKPVRVVEPGAVPTLPLRMVAAGTGANVALTLFVIGEGRWAVDNFPMGEIDASRVTWDYAAADSTYASLRTAALAGGGGRTWLTSYAQKGALLSPIANAATGAYTQYVTGGYGAASTIADAYVQQALSNGETTTQCTGFYQALGVQSGVVVDPCPSDGSDCGPLAAGQIPSTAFTCGELDDLAVALTGMHPRDVWLTRLEADLPRAALADDLVLRASDSQAAVDSSITAGKLASSPCPSQGGAAVPPRTGAGRGRGTTLIGTLLAALGLGAALRRLARPAPRQRAARAKS